MKYLLTLAIAPTFFISVTHASAASSLTYIATDQAPKPVASYSQAVVVNPQKGNLIFVSGQIPNDAKTGKLFEGDIQTATRKTLQNIDAILRASGSNLQNVVRMDVFLKDFKDRVGMNEEYKKFFPNGHFPARQTVQVGMDNRIEISCIALVVK